MPTLSAKKLICAAILFCGLPSLFSYAQPKEKTRLAVVDFQIKVEGAQKALDTAMSDLLIDALVETGNYTILERSALQEIREEQILALSGEVDAATGAEVGKLVGAEYLVVGVVSKFEEKTGGGLGGIVGGKALSGVGWFTSELGITIRIIHSTTGEIVASEKSIKKKTRSVWSLRPPRRRVPWAGACTRANPCKLRWKKPLSAPLRLSASKFRGWKKRRRRIPVTRRASI